MFDCEEEVFVIPEFQKMEEPQQYETLMQCRASGLFSKYPADALVAPEDIVVL